MSIRKVNGLKDRTHNIVMRHNVKRRKLMYKSKNSKNKIKKFSNTRLDRKIIYNYDDLIDANLFYDAFKKSKTGSAFKGSTKQYEQNMLLEFSKLKNALENHTYKPKPLHEFVINDRGKKRVIRANHISDRVLNHVLCDNVLNPILEHYLVFNNGASVRGKGISHMRKNLASDLHRFYKKYGTEGYILLIDFSKFFDNIDHKKFLNSIRDKIPDDDIFNLIKLIIDDFKIDVSFLSDEEFEELKHKPFNSVEYADIPSELQTGEKYINSFFGIGSQISQIAGVYFPTRIDTYISCVKGCRYTGRFMDDSYVIHNSKEFLQQLLDEITEIASGIGIYINPKKTQIVKLSRGFTFMKIKYTLYSNGHLKQRLVNKNVNAERRKLKKYKNLLDKNIMPYKDIEDAFKSWKNAFYQYLTMEQIKKMDKLFNELFVNNFKLHAVNDKKERSC